MEQSEKDLRNKLLEVIQFYDEKTRDILHSSIREFSREHYARAMAMVGKNIKDAINDGGDENAP